MGFSPAYDLLNSTLALGGAEEEMALMLAGRRKGFRRRELVGYFCMEKLGLTAATVFNTLSALATAREKWEQLIGISFLSAESKVLYLALMRERFERLQI